MRKYSVDDIRKTLKAVDSWWTVLVVDPFAIRLTLWFANHTRLRPNFFTVVSLVLSLVSAYLFSRAYFVYGAIVYQISFLVDCIDGKLAILKGTDSDAGLWFDTVSDKLRLLANVLGLAIGVPGTSKLAIIFVGLYLWDETESLLFYRMLEKAGGQQEQSARLDRLPVAIRIREYMKKRRIAGPLSLVEQDTVVFFVMPLLRMVALGFKIGIVMNLVGRVVTILHFWFWRYRRSRT